MKFTLSWLKAPLDTDADAATIAARLTSIGLEVEALEDAGARLKDFTVAHVISAEKHPNADKLKLCMVDTGSGAPVQVVCGAPNAHTGMKAVFAKAGVVIPATGDILKIGTIRGVESRGMLCSARELQLGEDHPASSNCRPTPKSANQRQELSASPIRCSICRSRPIAATAPRFTAWRAISRPRASDVCAKATSARSRHLRLTAEARARFPAGAETAAPLFAGRMIRGVKNGPSPQWLQDWLKAVGLRPISALVDVTNFLSLDRGRPLHVYDAASSRETCAPASQRPARPCWRSTARRTRWIAKWS
jgi:phenylalanyl-tRNA synthetase beta chain